MCVCVCLFLFGLFYVFYLHFLAHSMGGLWAEVERKLSVTSYHLQKHETKPFFLSRTNGTLYTGVSGGNKHHRLIDKPLLPPNPTRTTEYYGVPFCMTESYKVLVCMPSYHREITTLYYPKLLCNTEYYKMPPRSTNYY